MKKNCNIIPIVISIFALIISAFTLYWFIYDLKLKNRPYLFVVTSFPETYLYTDPKTNTSGHRKIRVAMDIYNKGIIPASNIKIDWYIATDIDGELMSPEEFYRTEYGKAPQYKTVFPEQIIPLPPYKPDVSPITEKLYFYVLVSYEGLTRSIWGHWGAYRKYWYLLKSEYKFIYQSPEKVYGVQTYYETDWDREKNIMPPVLKEYK